MLDDLNLSGLYRILSVMDVHPNVEVRLFNPFINRGLWARAWGFITDFGRVNHRMRNETA